MTDDVSRLLLHMGGPKRVPNDANDLVDSCIAGLRLGGHGRVVGVGGLLHGGLPHREFGFAR